MKLRNKLDSLYVFKKPSVTLKDDKSTNPELIVKLKLTQLLEETQLKLKKLETSTFRTHVQQTKCMQPICFTQCQAIICVKKHLEP